MDYTNRCLGVEIKIINEYASPCARMLHNGLAFFTVPTTTNNSRLDTRSERAPGAETLESVIITAPGVSHVIALVRPALDPF